MNVADYKTILILFEPKQGGNHFTNILSLSPKLQNRTNCNNYRQYLMDCYQTLSDSAHFGEIGNVEVNSPDKIVSFIKSADYPVLVCGHLAESYYMLDILRQQGKIAIINFENYHLNDSVLRRMNFGACNFTDLLEWAHRSDTVSKMFDVKPNDMYTIQTNWLFEQDITSLINNINRDLDLDLDIDFCMELHQLWVKKVNYY